jgi:acetylglutamate kinase
VDGPLIQDFCAAGVVPVIPSLAQDADGGWLNVNADTAAAAVATALKADKLVFLTDTPGILRDKADPGSLIRELTPAGCRNLIAEGIIDRGMIPKVEACMACLEAGVRKIHIIDGRLRHAILLEIFTHEGIGTQISRDVGNDEPSPRRRVGQAAPIAN